MQGSCQDYKREKRLPIEMSFPQVCKCFIYTFLKLLLQSPASIQHLKSRYSLWSCLLSEKIYFVNLPFSMIVFVSMSGIIKNSQTDWIAKHSFFVMWILNLWFFSNHCLNINSSPTMNTCNNTKTIHNRKKSGRK